VAEEAFERLFTFRYRSIPARANSTRARPANSGCTVSRSTTSGSTTSQVSPLVSIVARPRGTIHRRLTRLRGGCDAALRNFYEVPVYVDRALAEDETIVFRSGTNTDTMSVSYEDFEKLVRPTVAGVADPFGSGGAEYGSRTCTKVRDEER
jgi:Aminoacyl-tRNA editing domain